MKTTEFLRGLCFSMATAYIVKLTKNIVRMTIQVFLFVV